MLIYFNESDNLINSSDENDLASNNDSENLNLNKEVLNCKCRDISDVMLKRICKKSTAAAEMKNELKIINTLKIFVKIKINDDSLKHVCYKHLLRLVDHIKLQVNMLNFSELRKRLWRCWKQRHDLKTFKTSLETTLW